MTEYDFEVCNRATCYYCGEMGPLGFDRLNSQEDYIHENVVPCCASCNSMKSDRIQDEFIERCNKVSEFSALPY